MTAKKKKKTLKVVKKVTKKREGNADVNQDASLLEGYRERQRNEIEALNSIFMDEFEVLQSTRKVKNQQNAFSSWNISIKLCTLPLGGQSATGISTLIISTRCLWRITTC
jgi:hypothetical protein